MKLYTLILLLLFSISWSADYQLLWQDSFDDISNHWSRGDWVFDGNDAEFSPENISVKNNELSLSLTKKTSDDSGKDGHKPYWGAELYTQDEYEHGKYSIKMKPSGRQGTISSFFLLHIDFDPNWKALDWYEVDIEFPGKNTEVQFNVRWMEKGALKDIPVTIKLGFDASKTFHNYMIDWTPYYISFYVDGKCLSTCKDKNILNEMNHAMSVRVNHWVSNAPSWAGKFNPAELPLQSTYKDLVVKKYIR